MLHFFVAFCLNVSKSKWHLSAAWCDKWFTLLFSLFCDAQGSSKELKHRVGEKFGNVFLNYLLVGGLGCFQNNFYLG